MLSRSCIFTISSHFMFFFFNDTSTTEIYTLSLHDALPIYDFQFCRLLLVEGIQLAVDLDLSRIFNFARDTHVGPLQFVDRKSTRLNSSHLGISYAVFCLKKKKNKHINKIA